MIRLSAKSRYGTRIMVGPALHYGKGPVALKDIAKRQEIFVGYMEQIMPILKCSGLIKANRGAHGGYLLSKDPSKIKMKDIVVALEGNVFLLECINNSKICERYSLCAPKDLWEELCSLMKNFLGSRILKDLAESQQEKEKASTPVNKKYVKQQRKGRIWKAKFLGFSDRLIGLEFSTEPEVGRSTETLWHSIIKDLGLEVY